MRLSDLCSILIQAGGQGVRLRPYTHVVPKPMLPVGGVPILQQLLDQVIAAGGTECHISIGHLGEFIQIFFGDSYEGCNLVYLKEESPTGTVGAARYFSGKDNAVLIVNGDLLLQCDLLALVSAHVRSGADITTGTQTTEVKVPYGVINRDSSGLLQRVDEKPELAFEVCCGVNVLSQKVIELIPEAGPYDMPRLLEAALASGFHVDTHALDGHCTEVGNVEKYHELIADTVSGPS